MILEKGHPFKMSCGSVITIYNCQETMTIEITFVVLNASAAQLMLMSFLGHLQLNCRLTKFNVILLNQKSLKPGLHNAICLTDSFIFMQVNCVDF